MSEKFPVVGTVATYVAIPLGWATLALAYFFVLPLSMQTGISALIALGAGLAWTMLAWSVKAFLRPAAEVGSEAVVVALRLIIALAYCFGIYFVAKRFIFTMVPVTFRQMAGVQAVLFVAVLLAMLATSFIGVKARKLSASQESARSGIVELRTQLELAISECKVNNSVFGELEAGLSKARDTLRYTSPSAKPFAAELETRMLSALQRLRGWAQFAKSLNAGDAQLKAQYSEMQGLLADLNNDAVTRSRLST